MQRVYLREVIVFSEETSHSQPRHSRRTFLSTVAFPLLIALHSRFAFGSDSKDTLNMDETPSPTSLERAILLAAGYMQRACGPDGRFIYLVNIRTGEKSSSYNVVRHAGAIHALAMLQRRYPSVETKGAMLRATGYMRRLYIGPAAVPDVLVVWSKPAPNHELTVLGASGLGLLALAEVRPQSPESIPLSELQALGRFILLQQREDGSFASNYSFFEGPEDALESLYYPGEAVLGLLALYQLDRSPVWLTAATKALMYLARSRRDLSQLPADHWALIATAKLISSCDTAMYVLPEEELQLHAGQICSSILREGLLPTAETQQKGLPERLVRTAPIATRVEGLLAALTFLADKSLCRKIRHAVGPGVFLLTHSQLQSGPYAGGIPQSVGMLPDSSAQIRIDYVQHALSAWLQYQP